METPQNLKKNTLNSFLVESNSKLTNNQKQAQLLREQINNDSINISLNKSEMEIVDDIEFYKEGWRSRYYWSKFDIKEQDDEYDNFRNNVVCQYVKGLSWVMQYYYQGCASWSWFYPFHYAPFASDCINILNVPITFPKNTKPVNLQLLFYLNIV